jgi:hypothetical protein
LIITLYSLRTWLDSMKYNMPHDFQEKLFIKCKYDTEN